MQTRRTRVVTARFVIGLEFHLIPQKTQQNTNEKRRGCLESHCADPSTRDSVTSFSDYLAHMTRCMSPSWTRMIQYSSAGSTPQCCSSGSGSTKGMSCLHTMEKW